MVWTMVPARGKRCLPCWMRRRRMGSPVCLPPLTARRAWSPFRGTCISGILILHGLTAPKRAMTSRWKAAPELLYTPAAAYAAAEHSLITLGGTDWVLLEFVPDVAAAEVETALRQITGSGYRVLLAHIERYPRLAPQRCAAPPEGTVRHPLSGQCGHGAGGRILSAPEAGPLAEGRPLWTRSPRTHITALPGPPGCRRPMSGCAAYWDSRMRMR